MRYLAGLTDLSSTAIQFRTPFQPNKLLKGDDNSDKILVHKFFNQLKEIPDLLSEVRMHYEAH